MYVVTSSHRSDPAKLLRTRNFLWRFGPKRNFMSYSSSAHNAHSLRSYFGDAVLLTNSSSLTRFICVCEACGLMVKEGWLDEL
jgi:hypothetical protein